MPRTTQRSIVLRPAPLLALAEARRASAHRWFRFLWGAHQVLLTLGWGLSGLVPFGLALMLFVPPGESQRQVNWVVLMVSAVAFCAQLVASTTRLRERAEVNRDIADKLGLAVAEYQSGIMSLEALQKRLEAASRLAATEISA